MEVRSVLNTCSKWFLGHFTECLGVVVGNAQERRHFLVCGCARSIFITRPEFRLETSQLRIGVFLCSTALVPLVQLALLALLVLLVLPVPLLLLVLLVLLVRLALLVRITGVGLGIARVADVSDNYGCEPRECAIARERNWVQRSA